MSDACCGSSCDSAGEASARYRRVLWVALAVNAGMCVVEILAGWQAGSTALWADALDFAGDAANYTISLLVLPLGLMWRARAAMLKGLTMTAFGTLVLVKASWSVYLGAVPDAATMGVVGGVALLANLLVAALLYAFREGDANMRSVWLCSRNDAIGNVAVMLAAVGVLGTGSVLPDIAVAAIIAGLGASSGLTVVRQARREMNAESSRVAISAR